MNITYINNITASTRQLKSTQKLMSELLTWQIEAGLEKPYRAVLEAKLQERRIHIPQATEVSFHQGLKL